MKEHTLVSSRHMSWRERTPTGVKPFTCGKSFAHPNGLKVQLYQNAQNNAHAREPVKCDMSNVWVVCTKYAQGT